MSAADQNKPPEKKNIERPLEDLISGLSVLKKSIGIYPAGHPSVNLSVTQALNLFKFIFASTDALTIIGAKNSLIINGTKFDKTSRHFADFAAFLNQRGIAAITFTEGLTGDALQEFYRCLLAQKPGTSVHGSGNAKNIFSAFPHIHITALDFSSIRLSDDATTQDEGLPAVNTDVSAIWEAFTRGSFSSRMVEENNNPFPSDNHSYAPGTFTVLLNEYKVPPEHVLKSYNTVLAEYFNDPAGPENQRTAGKAFFNSLYDILPDLSPDLKSQLLSTTFRHITNTKDERELIELFSCMPGDMIVAILEEARIENREISPALVGLLANLARTREEAQVTENDEGPYSPISRQHMQMLFSREQYEEYVPREYQGTLREIAAGKAFAEKAKPPSFAIEEIIKTLEDKSLNRQIAYLLLALMEQDLDEHAYRDFTISLSGLVPELLRNSEYVLLNTMYKSIRSHALLKSGPIVRNAAAAFLNIFTERKITAAIAAACDTIDEEQHKELEDFIVLCGAQNISWLMDHYVQQETQGGAPQIFKMLCRFGKAAATTAVTKLTDTGTPQTMALLKIIHACGDSSCIGEVRKLLASSNSDVRMEALKTLLKVQDAAAVDVLRRLLYGSDAALTKKAYMIVR